MPHAQERVRQMDRVEMARLARRAKREHGKGCGCGWCTRVSTSTGLITIKG